MDRAITATEADIVKACNCQATVCADIHKEFLLPSLLQHHHIYEIVEKTSQKTLKLSFFLFTKPKLTWQEWRGHNLMSVTNKVSDHQHHHEYQWLAAMTAHWVHKLPMVGVDKNNKSTKHFKQTITQTSASWVSVTFQKQEEDSVIMLASTQETKPRIHCNILSTAGQHEQSRS
jgi:hypothetical protein